MKFHEKPVISLLLIISALILLPLLLFVGCPSSVEMVEPDL
jgi:hypothetical protein